jgi:hypothetical protein
VKKKIRSQDDFNYAKFFAVAMLYRHRRTGATLTELVKATNIRPEDLHQALLFLNAESRAVRIGCRWHATYKTVRWTSGS